MMLYEGKKMIVPYERLKNRWGLHSHKFTSKYNGEEYKLYDFYFKED